MSGSDQQTFSRGVTASLLGFGVQLLIAAVFGVLALWLRGAVLTIAAWQAIGGLALWLALAVVYQQHKLERIESLEADELAARHGEQSSIFQTTADDLSLARRRVQRLHRWGLPLVSLLTSAYLLAMGAWLFKLYLPLLHAPPLVKDSLGIDPLQVRLIGIDGMARWRLICVVAAGLAFVAFLVCRYLAGMAKLRDWSLLRGGAGYMMGTSLTGVTLAVGYALLFAPTSVVIKYLAVILPGVMFAIGLEIVLNLVLDFYRPRKADQPHRAAFDSRLLSLLTAPESIARTINETINYQFGFEVTRSWFWQLFSKAFGYLIMLGAAVLIAVSSMMIVEPHEQAVVTRFGQVTGQPLAQGLHWKLPWPIESVQRVNVTGIRQIVVGSLEQASDLKSGIPILWANEHYNTKPTYLLVAPPPPHNPPPPNNPPPPRPPPH
ncbi:MAG: SPFH domain-containing protein, partial [Phycisphaeraceae bacterium]